MVREVSRIRGPFTRGGGGHPAKPKVGLGRARPSVPATRPNPKAAMFEMLVEQPATATPEETQQTAPRIGNVDGRMFVEVRGERISPGDTEGWKVSGKRIKEIVNGTSGGESDATQRQSRPRTRVNYVKKITSAITKGARMPVSMPKEDIKIVVRPRGGLNVAKMGGPAAMAAITRAAKVTREEASEDTVGINAQQNIIVVSTPDEQRATRYARMTTIEEGGKTYEVSAYRTAPDGTVKGVVRGINIEETAEDITLNIVNKYNPTAVEAHRIGDSTAVIVLFAGNKVPHYIKYGIVLMKCGLYRKHFDVCRACGKLGHRRDVCPNPGNRFCFGCGKVDPEEGHELACQPKFKLCGGPHPTGEWNCKNKYKQPYVVKCRQWEKKTDASERRITAGDFPLLGPRAIERTNSTSRRRADSQRRVDSMERRGRSISRRREASRPRGETSWADTIRTPKLGGRQSNADSQHDKNRQEDSAAIKALRDENEKLRKKILEQDNIIKEINEKLAALVRNKEEQASPAQAAKTNEIMIEEDSEIEVGPRTDRAAEPAPKRRAIESLKERKTLDRHGERLDKVEERLTSLEKNVAQIEKNVAQMILQVQAQIQTQMQSMEARIVATLQQSWMGHMAQQQPPRQ